jgi:hypothetical protein
MTTSLHDNLIGNLIEQYKLACVIIEFDRTREKANITWSANASLKAMPARPRGGLQLRFWFQGRSHAKTVFLVAKSMGILVPTVAERLNIQYRRDSEILAACKATIAEAARQIDQRFPELQARKRAHERNRQIELAVQILSRQLFYKTLFSHNFWQRKFN